MDHAYANLLFRRNISKEELASQMTCNVKTANKYYYIHSKVENKLKVGRYLDAMTKQSDNSEDDDEPLSSRMMRLKDAKSVPKPKQQNPRYAPKRCGVTATATATASLPNNATRAMIVDALSRFEQAIDTDLVWQVQHRPAERQVSLLKAKQIKL
jgi:hypothetical protein